MTRNTILTALLIATTVTMLTLLAFIVRSDVNSKGCCGNSKTVPCAQTNQ